MVHQVTHSVSSFSKCLKLFSEFLHIYVDPSDIPLAVFGMSMKTHISFFSIFRSYT